MSSDALWFPTHNVIQKPSIYLAVELMASKRYPRVAFVSQSLPLYMVSLFLLNRGAETVNVSEPHILFFYACVKLLIYNREVEK